MKKTGWIVVAIIAVILYVIAGLLPIRLDLTADKRYTVSEPVKKLLAGLDQPIEVIVLLNEENMPAAFKKLSASTQSLINNYRSYSNGKLTYRMMSADEFMADADVVEMPDSIKAEWLKANAVKHNEITKSGTKASFVYPLALVQSGEYLAPVNLLQGQSETGFQNPDAQAFQQDMINKAEAQMEYQFASAIQSIIKTSLPRIAYTVGRGQPTGPETYDLSQALQSKYEFYTIDLAKQPSISDSIDVVMVVKPTDGFTDAEKLKLDQYLMRGGNILFLLDALNADMDSLRQSGVEFTAYAREINLEDLLFRYGARINPNLVMDRQSDLLPQSVGTIGGQPQIELLPWPYFPLLYSSNNHPISKNLDAVIMQFPNSIDTVQAEGVQKEILLASSNTSRLIGTPVIVTVEILKQLENASAFKDSHVPIAVLLEGSFKSLYANRMAGELAFVQAESGQVFLPVSAGKGKILVTGDGDWVLNAITKEGPLPMGTNPYTQYEFANRTFLLNTIDYMTDENGIMESRSRDFVLRLLDPKQLETGAFGWKWLNIGLPLVLLSFAALLVYMWRRKRYARV